MKKLIINLLTLKYNYFYLFFLNILFLFFGINYNVFAQDNPQVLNTWLQYSDAPNSLYHHLTKEAFQFLSAREEKVSQLATPGEWQQRQSQIKQTMWEVLGPFSKKTPLNALITGKIKKEGYRIENVIYESLPGFYVTASLFIPDKIQKPAPAILFCSGHSDIAYRRPLYQLPLLNLVKKGFIVLAIDPVGQGERLQYYDSAKGASTIGSSTKEHSYPSVQVALIGESIARYFIWDGIRGIDYLVSREEVDPERIGVHGLSGGGTQTAYIEALDDRVAAAAPACYITSYRRLMESIGAQDGEQNFYHGILQGIDHADFIEARAPKPTLIIANTRDFFSIQGARETYVEVKKVYDIYGKQENLEKVESDYGHGYTNKNREAMYAFFQKNLINPGSSAEEDVEYLTSDELQKTTTGQLSTSLGGETIFSLNCKEAEKVISHLQDSRKPLGQHLQKVPVSAQKLSGYRKPLLTDSPVFTGRTQNEGYVTEKYYVKGEGDGVIPYLLFIPDKVNNKAVICLYPGGKAGISDDKETLNMLTGQGYTVIAPDLPGTGELGDGALKGDAYIDNISYNVWYTAMLIGRSIVGIQAAGVVKLAHLVKQQKNIDEVYGIAKEGMSPVLLHAAAFDPVISRVAILEPYASYRSVVMNRFYKPDLVYSLVPGALTAYDLPDIAASLAPVKLLIAGMTDANGQRSDEEEISKDLDVIKQGYRYKKAENQLEILPFGSMKQPEILFGKWLK